MIDRDEVYKEYMKKVEEIAEGCDWKTHFQPQEIVDIICSIVERSYKVEPK
jgi:hypothetical protein